VTTELPADVQALLDLGFKVLPCHSVRGRSCTCGAADCTSPGKHPRTPNGHKDATADAGVVESWLNRYGADSINWAVATGAASGVYVVDVDLHHDGVWHEELWGPVPETRTVATGNGGRHYYFTYPYDGEPLKSRNPFVPGVDLKSDGGYVVAPGSRHVSGATYRLLNEGTSIADGSTELVTHVRQRSTSEPVEVGSLLTRIPSGRRNITLFTLGCRTRRQTHDDRLAVEATVRAYNQLLCDEPLDEAEVKAIIESVFKQDHTEESFPDWDPDCSITRPVTSGIARLNLIKASEARDRPPMNWLVEGMVPARGTGQLFGPSGRGKTFNALDLALSVVNGLPWLGQPVRHRGPVVYVLGEGSGDIGQRIAAWSAAHPEADGDAGLYLSEEQGISLIDPAQVQQLIQDVPDETKLIIFDTQAIHTAGADENSAKDMGLLVAHLRRISVELDAMAMTVHHTGWNKSRERGSSAVRAGLDTIMQFDEGTLTCVKQRGAARFEPIAVELVAIEGSLVPAINSRPLAKVNPAKDGALVQRITSVLREGPFTLTRAELINRLGSNNQESRLTLQALLLDGTVIERTGLHQEGTRQVRRPLYGLAGETP
jgi:hypothetical protein